jgi:hypothetical protein
MENSKWKMDNSKMANGKWQMENGKSLSAPLPF